MILVSGGTVYLHIKGNDLCIITHNGPEEGLIRPKHVVLRDSRPTWNE
jgi:hypothetical protein